jgi:hypothetical protein
MLSLHSPQIYLTASFRYFQALNWSVVAPSRTWMLCDIYLITAGDSRCTVRTHCLRHSAFTDTQDRGEIGQQKVML